MVVAAHSEVIRRVWRELEPELQEQGYELIEVEHVFHLGRPVLRLFIDKAGGVTLDDCQAASRLAGAILDMKDFIEGQYSLEMSSPGFDRPVRKPKDFERFAGELVKVHVNVPIGGRKQFKGELKGFRDGLIRVDCDGTPCEIHIENLKKAHLMR
jgi:ribosome maturation factor RimP